MISTKRGLDRQRVALIERFVETVSDVEIVRLIRNASLDGMTKNAYPTTELQQLSYWMANHRSLQAWIYELPEMGVVKVTSLGDEPSNQRWTYSATGRSTPIGYASLRRDDDGKLWSFMAVTPEYRGQGFGSLIQRHHVRQTQEDVYDEILETNIACLEMTRRSGDWRVLRRENGLVYQVSEASARE